VPRKSIAASVSLGAIALIAAEVVNLIARSLSG
jgi:hypothetical protein